MPRKKKEAVVSESQPFEATVYPEVNFMFEVETQESRALALAMKHEGGAKTYLCKLGKRTLKVKVWESAN
jgi:hypothetical protein